MCFKFQWQSASKAPLVVPGLLNDEWGCIRSLLLFSHSEVSVQDHGCSYVALKFSSEGGANEIILIRISSRKKGLCLRLLLETV